MRVLVCGSRHFNDYQMLSNTLSRLLEKIDPEDDITTIIHGAARGADTLAGVWAVANGCKISEYPADWNAYGRRAGPIRNKQMLVEGKPDLVVAFLAPDSRGTKNMIEQATKAGVPVEVINIGP